MTESVEIDNIVTLFVLHPGKMIQLKNGNWSNFNEGNSDQVVIQQAYISITLLVVAGQTDCAAIGVLLAQEGLVEHRTCSG
jgi:hypothetical protein